MAAQPIVAADKCHGFAAAFASELNPLDGQMKRLVLSALLFLSGNFIVQAAVNESPIKVTTEGHKVTCQGVVDSPKMPSKVLSALKSGTACFASDFNADGFLDIAVPFEVSEDSIGRFEVFTFFWKGKLLSRISSFKETGIEISLCENCKNKRNGIHVLTGGHVNYVYYFNGKVGKWERDEIPDMGDAGE